MYWMVWRAQGMPPLFACKISLIAGVLFGLTMALFHLWRRKVNKLPDWKDYNGIRRTPETGLTLAEWHEFPRYALACILMHAVKTAPARFWRVFGVFASFPSETP
ncbi:Uncharacterised protein [Klebsiella pneumoniae]|nr:Uncharacterised protein [Klebsiella pneumoniae]